MKKLIKTLFPRSVRHTMRGLERTLRQNVYRATFHVLRFLPGGHTDVITTLLDVQPLTPESIIQGYALGCFPSPVHSGPMRWHDPDPRAIMPLEAIHIPKRMRSYLNTNQFTVRFDTDFDGVQESCAMPLPGRETTFITPELKQVFSDLHRMGFAHSVEAYEGSQLVGGLYGVSLGGYFSISSMFHTTDNASKIALLTLVEVLRRARFELLDVWWMQPHFAQLGAIEIPRDEFKRRLAHALIAPMHFCVPEEPVRVDYRQYQ